MDWYIGGEYVYIGSKYASYANLAHSGEQELFNLRLGVENEQLRVELWGKNIFETDGADAVSVFIDYDTFIFETLSVSLPDKATYGLQATYKFGER